MKHAVTGYRVLDILPLRWMCCFMLSPDVDEVRTRHCGEKARGPRMRKLVPTITVQRPTDEFQGRWLTQISPPRSDRVSGKTD